MTDPRDGFDVFAEFDSDEPYGYFAEFMNGTWVTVNFAENRAYIAPDYIYPEDSLTPAGEMPTKVVPQYEVLGGGTVELPCPWLSGAGDYWFAMSKQTSQIPWDAEQYAGEELRHDNYLFWTSDINSGDWTEITFDQTLLDEDIAAWTDEGAYAANPDLPPGWFDPAIDILNYGRVRFNQDTGLYWFAVAVGTFGSFTDYDANFSGTRRLYIATAAHPSDEWELSVIVSADDILDADPDFYDVGNASLRILSTGAIEQSSGEIIVAYEFEGVVVLPGGSHQGGRRVGVNASASNPADTWQKDEFYRYEVTGYDYTLPFPYVAAEFTSTLPDDVLPAADTAESFFRIFDLFTSPFYFHASDLFVVSLADFRSWNFDTPPDWTGYWAESLLGPWHAFPTGEDAFLRIGAWDGVFVAWDGFNPETYEVTTNIRAGESVAALEPVAFEVEGPIASLDIFPNSDDNWYAYCYPDDDDGWPDYWLRPPDQDGGWGVSLV